MKWEVLMGDVVDVQPAFNLMAAMSDNLTGAEERDFAVHKLRKCIARLRETADYLEKELKARTPKKR
jgi:hypothetical protein